MEQRVAETVLDSLSEKDYNWLHTIALTTTQQLVALLAESKVLDPTDSDPKPGDLDDEPEHRIAALRRVKAAQVVGALLVDVMGEVTSSEAATAVWLGASLADLGSATGSSRQAARKRWPDLGQIYRTRRWLYGHRDSILYICDLLIEARPNVKRRPQFTQEDVDEAYTSLIWALAQVRADFESGSAMLEPPTSNQRIVRWQRLRELVDTHIRRMIEVLGPADGEAGFATAGAGGLMEYFDTATTATAP
ncbi:MAG TPA: hypothetical protein VJ914_32850 [Pseudonocardiaceae bacterium]|nr:hypothetical protein [Pseudonocardiaceae bacterium]